MAYKQQFSETALPAPPGYELSLPLDGQNNQGIATAGLEADLDSQRVFGLTYVILGTLHTAASSLPFDRDSHI
ncbi:hypothetical protein EDD16DRAFT_1707076 [Pisolithus croceorrhizus]|nr:hypothetical protein EV401DRAFT_2079288 [Pisolithus croceorrhizus]KAI6118960.1 hypothetical protein EDD16DRAFT_1707076 [Pisolithus croceorrhizus]KAI6163971.1 hypothetical protein EDD17DRAFT_1755562 [Pisolithus thermaeus]